MKEGKVFDSGLAVVSPTIILQAGVGKILKSIQRDVGDCEFSVLLKGRWIEGGYLVLNEYYVPRQRVDSTSVDYTEDISVYREEGYNVIAHSHPFSHGLNRFSVTDEETINSNFPCSILCNLGGAVVAGNLRLEIKEVDTTLLVPVEEKNIFVESIPMDVDGVDKIKKKPRVIVSQKSFGDNNEQLEEAETEEELVH